MMVHVQALLCCFPRTELKLLQLHVTTPLKNAINQYICIYTAREDLVSCSPFLKSCLLNEQFRHEAEK